MRKQLSTLIVLLMSFSLFLTAAMAEDDNAIMSVAPTDQSKLKISTPIEFYLKRLELRAYSAVVGSESDCEGDEDCLKRVKKISFWKCVGDVCGGTNKEFSNPGQCFSGVPEGTTKEQWDMLSGKFCEFLQTPEDKDIRQTMLKLTQDPDESFIIEGKSFVKALGGSAKACENYIKNYVGARASDWNVGWYQMLSGCRILSRESTLEKEEKDFYSWFGAYRQFNCAAIMNIELSHACQNLTSPSPSPFDPATEKEPFYIKAVVERLGLRAYDAARGDVSLCQKDEGCLQRAARIKAALCVAKVCPGNASEKDPAACLGNVFGELSPDVKEQINKSYCSIIKSMDDIGMQQSKKFFPKLTERDLVEFESYILAASESSASCQNYIKHYVGTYGPQWNYQWYRAMSECRIISKESPAEVEESDFYTWIGASRQFSCANIVDNEARTVCPTRDIAKEFTSK